MADPFYNSARWQRVRQLRLQMDHYLCAPCLDAGRLTVATVVDHRIDRRTSPSLAYDLDNLTSMCVSCHSQKTARGPEAGSSKTTRKLQPRKGCDAQGNPLDPSHPWNASKVGREIQPPKNAGFQTAALISAQLVSKKD